MDIDAIRGWLQVLDELSFYELFRIDPSASQDEVHDAFLRFAADFHPDAHAARSREERAALERIFRRGNEAYRVLSSHELRTRYDEIITRAPGAQPSATSLQESPPGRRPSSTNIPVAMLPLQARVRIQAAKPFVRRAEELVKNGDPRQARIQLVLAMHMDANNPALEEYMKTVEALIAGNRGK